MRLRIILILSVTGLLISSCVNKESISYSPGKGILMITGNLLKTPKEAFLRICLRKMINRKHVWQKISLPHTANIESADSSGMQWQGISWYRKFFIVPGMYKGKSVSLQFGAAMQVARIYLNGELVQTHLGGYLPFHVKLDERIKFGKQNCILIELDNRDNPLIPPGKPLAEMDFNYYSGIYRNVTLLVKDKVHISDPVAADRVAGGGILVTFRNVSRESAEINIQADLENENQVPVKASLQFFLNSPDGTRCCRRIQPIWKSCLRLLPFQSAIYCKESPSLVH